MLSLVLIIPRDNFIGNKRQIKVTPHPPSSGTMLEKEGLWSCFELMLNILLQCSYWKWSAIIAVNFPI